MAVDLLEAIGEAIRDWGIDVARERGGVVATGWFANLLVVVGLIFIGLWFLRPDGGHVPLYVGIGCGVLAVMIRVILLFVPTPRSTKKDDA